MPSSRRPFKCIVPCDSILQVRTNAGVPLDRDDQGSAHGHRESGKSKTNNVNSYH